MVDPIAVPAVSVGAGIAHQKAPPPGTASAETGSSPPVAYGDSPLFVEGAVGAVLIRR